MKNKQEKYQMKNNRYGLITKGNNIINIKTIYKS